MFAGILITLREGLEAFLVVAILIGILAKMGQKDKYKYIWAGSAAAVTASIVLAYLIQLLSIQFEGRSAEVFEAVVAGVAIGVLTYMVIWMHKQSRHLKQELEKKVSVAVSKNQIWALLLLAFVTILREGIETALFLSAVSTANQGTGLMTGAIIGLVIAGMISFMIAKAAVRFNLRTFFLVTGTFIVVIAGGLVAHVSGVLQELGLNVLTQTPWDLSWLISDESPAGRLLHAFTGYMAMPTLLQILAYTAYVGVMVTFLWMSGGSTASKRQRVTRDADSQKERATPIDGAAAQTGAEWPRLR
ncbi:MAG: FTR1 family protein [Chloroflexi bacterium]|nr:FTR1 family protein [Chloroflexota bacterium]